MQVDRELNPMEEREIDPEAVAEELGVGWDFVERELEKTTPMGWLVLIGVLLLVMGLGGLLMLINQLAVAGPGKGQAFPATSRGIVQLNPGL